MGQQSDISVHVDYVISDKYSSKSEQPEGVQTLAILSDSLKALWLTDCTTEPQATFTVFLLLTVGCMYSRGPEAERMYTYEQCWVHYLYTSSNDPLSQGRRHKMSIKIIYYITCKCRVTLRTKTMFKQTCKFLIYNERFILVDLQYFS